MGTVDYMAPEQLRGEESDHRADIFAFGVIFYEMLAGERPFRGGSAAETISAILKQDALSTRYTSSAGTVTVVSSASLVVNGRGDR
jgi:serine/threonine protein kinase